MTRTKVGHLECDGGDFYIPIGFVPDFFFAADLSPTNPMIHFWWERQQDDMATGSQEGTQINGADGVVTKHADDAGIQAYDSSGRRPEVGLWEASSATLTALSGNTLTITARTVTAPGTLCRGTTSGVDETGATVDREALFECVVTSGNTGASEPTWPVEVEGRVVDGSCTWELVVDQALGRYGYQGVLIADDINTNGQELFYLAIDCDNSVDHGDVDGWPGGVEDA